MKIVCTITKAPYNGRIEEVDSENEFFFIKTRQIEYLGGLSTAFYSKGEWKKIEE